VSELQRVGAAPVRGDRCPGRRLTTFKWRHTLSHMKTATLSIRLDEDLDRLLGKASREAGRSRSEVAREALRRQLRLTQFEAIRRRMMPFAEARGFLTDEDVFDAIS
jgi:predicted transcriptional regulator